MPTGKLSLHRKDLLAAALCFALSTLITWWFIIAGKALYGDSRKMFLSCSIAGAKWAVQILAAFVFLSNRRWPFIRRISVVCLAGSLVLLPFCFPPVQRLLGLNGFLISLVACVLLMIALYYISVRRSGVSVKWFWGWMGCLTIAILLQLTVVFAVIRL